MSSGEKQLAAMANAIRFLSADAIEKSKSGHFIQYIYFAIC